MIRFLFFKKAFLAAGLLLAGSISSRAQTFQISLTDGGCFNVSKFGKAREYTDVAFDHMFTLKAGLLFPGRVGLGAFYERAHFSAKETLYPTGSNQPGKYIVAIAEPQQTIGLELYSQSIGSRYSYARFGFLLGYASARTPDPTSSSGYMESEGFGYNSGLDVSYVFRLNSRMSGVLNAGYRYGSVHYGPSNGGIDITSLSFPLTGGLSYKFAPSKTPARPNQFEQGE